MKAMGYSSKVVTDATLDSTTGNITVSKIENGTPGSSTLNLASIYAKKTDLYFDNIAYESNDIMQFQRDVDCIITDGGGHYDTLEYGGIRSFDNIVRNEKQLYFSWGTSQVAHYCFKIRAFSQNGTAYTYNIQYDVDNGKFIGGKIWRMNNVAYFIITGDASNINEGWSSDINIGMCIVYKYKSSNGNKTFYGILSFGELIHTAAIQGVEDCIFYAVPITNCSVFNFSTER